ncbi:MAG: hypothetical protein VB036_10820 [Propionicimonas sp.]|nr:hypothetical protein [Propionicimonas sp.]
MKRCLVLLLLPLLLVATGCSSVLGTGDWDQVKVTYLSGSDAKQAGDYTLVVTPKQASYTLDGKESTHELPTGAWQVLTTGVRTLGAHTPKNCLDGASLAIEASAEGSVKQSFEATSCDAGDLLNQAKAVAEQVISQLK